jgi:hypothetical protein
MFPNSITASLFPFFPFVCLVIPNASPRPFLDLFLSPYDSFNFLYSFTSAGVSAPIACFTLPDFLDFLIKSFEVIFPSFLM